MRLESLGFRGVPSGRIKRELACKSAGNFYELADRHFRTRAAIDVLGSWPSYSTTIGLGGDLAIYARIFTAMTTGD